MSTRESIAHVGDRASGAMSLPAQFDPFLMAPIREERDGRVLSVLSALARLNLDPWEEAAALSRMPGDRSALRLAELLAMLPGTAVLPEASRSLATRLVALLPGRTLPGKPGSTRSPAAAAAARPGFARYVIAYVVMTLLALAFQWLLVPRQGPPAAAPTHAVGTTSLAAHVAAGSAGP